MRRWLHILVVVVLSGWLPSTACFGYALKAAPNYDAARFACQDNQSTAHYICDAAGLPVSHIDASKGADWCDGEEFDSSLGMYYLRARYYKPDLGRFWTMDSYEGNNQDPASLHKYLYCHDDPANRIDPSGHFSLIGLSASIGQSFYFRGAAANVSINFVFSRLLNKHYSASELIWDATAGAALGGIGGKAPQLFKALSGKVGWQQLAKLLLAGGPPAVNSVVSTAEAVIKRQVLDGKETSSEQIVQLLMWNCVGQAIAHNGELLAGELREKGQRTIELLEQLKSGDLEGGLGSFKHIWTSSTPLGRRLIELEARLFAVKGDWSTELLILVKDLAHGFVDEEFENTTFEQMR